MSIAEAEKMESVEKEKPGATGFSVQLIRPLEADDIIYRPDRHVNSGFAFIGVVLSLA